MKGQVWVLVVRCVVQGWFMYSSRLGICLLLDLDGCCVASISVFVSSHYFSSSCLGSFADLLSMNPPYSTKPTAQPVTAFQSQLENHIVNDRVVRHDNKLILLRAPEFPIDLFDDILNNSSIKHPSNQHTLEHDSHKLQPRLSSPCSTLHIAANTESREPPSTVPDGCSAHLHLSDDAD